MQAYSLTIAQAGYVVYAFDFDGHGRNPVPMSGDVSAIDGTTQLLVTQTQAVIAAVSEPGRATALLGHSMATDILVRAETAQTGPMILLSAFSQAVTGDSPMDMLLIAGAWEPGLADFALRALQMVAPAAQMGDAVQLGDIRRKSMEAPYADHVAILYSRAGRAAAVRWLDGSFDRESPISVPPTGWALLGLLIAIVALAAPLLRRVPLTPATKQASQRLTYGRFAAVVIVPAVVAPLVAVPLNPGVLPVLVADHLALHLALYGVLQLALLRLWDHRAGPVAWPIVAFLVVWGLVVFGTALDRYGTNFWPNAQRLWIIAALCLGTVPFMAGDALLAWGAPIWQRILARLALLGSLGLAVALDPPGLFFLLLIAPVIVLFLLVFGLMGRWASARAGPAASGLALGLILAWALGVSFPLFVTGAGAG